LAEQGSAAAWSSSIPSPCRDDFLFLLLNCPPRESTDENGSPTDRALLLVNISQLLTLRSSSGNSSSRRGSDLKELGIIEDGAVLCAGPRRALSS
jgi:hypothetical protein